MPSADSKFLTDTFFFLKPVNSIEYQPLYIEFIFTSEFVDLAIHPYPLGFSVVW